MLTGKIDLNIAQNSDLTWIISEKKQANKEMYATIVTYSMFWKLTVIRLQLNYAKIRLNMVL